MSSYLRSRTYDIHFHDKALDVWVFRSARVFVWVRVAGIGGVLMLVLLSLAGWEWWFVPFPLGGRK